MRRHRDDKRVRGRRHPGEEQQFRGEERYREEYLEDDRWAEGGSAAGREGIGRPVSGYGSQGGGFGMGGSPGDYEGRRSIGAVGEMGLRGMAGVGGGGSFAGMGYPMGVGGHGTYVAGHRSTGYGYGPGGQAYDQPQRNRDWAPYREEPDWVRRQNVGYQGGGDLPRSSSQGEQSFRGRGPRGYKRSDDRIREDVCDRLTEDHDIDASDIDIKVEAGEVTLEGTVDERRFKWLAEEIAARCSGVVEVHNHLRVKRQRDTSDESRERRAEGTSPPPANGGRGQTQTAQTGLGAQNRTDR
jgi:hypothetical protein